MFGHKVKLDTELFNRAKKFADEAGYSSVEELISHLLDKEISNMNNDDSDSNDDEEIKKRLEGLGYIS